MVGIPDLRLSRLSPRNFLEQRGALTAVFISEFDRLHTNTIPTQPVRRTPCY